MGSRRLFCLDNINVEFEIKTDVDDDEEPVMIKAMTKFSTTEMELSQYPDFSAYLKQEEHPIERVKYWFHATDIISAENICTKGISVDQGSKKVDFSDGSGFYLTR